MGELKPYSGWELEPHPNVVWASRLDGRYLVEVASEDRDPYKGVLRVWDKDNDYRLLLDEPTGISYGAPFGPDVDDVRRWQARAIEVIDGK